MAAHKTTGPRLRAESQNRHPSLRRAGLFALTALLIASFALFGCGGGVSTTAQPPSQAPDTGAGNATATLTWATPLYYVNGAPLTGFLAGYKVYYGTQPGVYTSVDVGNVNTYAITGLTKGQTYYFAVTDYDTNGTESDYSLVVSKLII
jgi:hypothetical protein